MAAPLTRAGAALAVAAVFLVVASISAVAGLASSWPFVRDQHAAFANAAPQDRLEAAGYANALPVAAFDFFRAHLHRKERYYLAAPATAYISGVDRPAALRAFARYYLLPAISVDAADQADAIVSVGVDPTSLGVPLGEVVQSGSEPIWFARIRR